ncbi:MAG: hypothetical protein HY221_01890 [Candidatus Sungbacteria bacterium]|uniref:Uncharacterized protein n=1 Tax=Candidatus Sungiibacteriota bacterium TaxID=2750080 RepID=A0A932VRA1_9BACT|nr:hypothetical protein [Candidatus Sungbacteria bacterium]
MDMAIWLSFVIIACLTAALHSAETGSAPEVFDATSVREGVVEPLSLKSAFIPSNMPINPTPKKI